jgi:hypothetical protein
MAVLRWHACLPLQDLSDQNKQLMLQLAEASDAQNSLK